MRGSLTIRGLAQMFKAMDNNRNRKLDAEELETGLRDFGINLNQEQVGVLVKHFDKDGSGQISFNEFLTAIRVSLNSFLTMLVG
jgi:calcyphosin